MTIMLTGTSPNAELYSRALSNAYRWYYRLIDPDWSIEQDPEIWIKKAWRDPVLAQAMQTRMHMVAGREWQIQPGRKNPSPDDTRAADVVADAFARIAKFSEARALLATSVLRGSAYAFTEGTRETVTLAGLRGNWWTPRKLRNISKQRFIYTPETITHEDGRRSIEVQTRFYPLMDPWPVVIPQEFAERLIKVIYLDEEDRLTGIGGRPLLESVYFMFWCKAEVMKSGLQTLEKWAGGMLIGKTDLNAQPGEMGRDSDSVRDKMLTTLESMRGRHVGVVDKEDEIEHIDGGASNSVFLEFLQYMDDKIVGLILGSVLPFGQGGDGSGSYARAVEERAVSDLILDFDKQNISEAITDTVIRLFWKNNRPQLAAAGLADAAMPQFAILPERRDDFAANAQILSQAINSGMPIKASEAYEKLGLTQPTQEEIDAGDVIEKEEPAPGGFPFRESPGAKFGDDPLDGVTVNGYNGRLIETDGDDIQMAKGRRPKGPKKSEEQKRIEEKGRSHERPEGTDEEGNTRAPGEGEYVNDRGEIRPKSEARWENVPPHKRTFTRPQRRKWAGRSREEQAEHLEKIAKREEAKERAAAEAAGVDPEGGFLPGGDRIPGDFAAAWRGLQAAAAENIEARAAANADDASPEAISAWDEVKKSGDVPAAFRALGEIAAHPDATDAEVELFDAIEDSPQALTSPDYGRGEHSTDEQREARDRLDEAVGEAEREMEDQGHDPRPAAEAPSTSRKRCPDGEHKDKDGSCRPVT